MALVQIPLFNTICYEMQLVQGFQGAKRQNSDTKKFCDFCFRQEFLKSWLRPCHKLRRKGKIQECKLEPHLSSAFARKFLEPSRSAQRTARAPPLTVGTPSFRMVVKRFWLLAEPGVLLSVSGMKHAQ